MAGQQTIHELYDSYRTLTYQMSHLRTLSQLVSPLRKLDTSLHELSHNPILPSRSLVSLRQELAAKASVFTSSFDVEDLSQLASEDTDAAPGLESHTRLVDLLAFFLRNHPNPAFASAVVQLFPAHLAAGEAARPLKLPRQASAVSSHKKPRILKPNSEWVKKLRSKREVRQMEKKLGSDKPGLLSCLLEDLGQSPDALSAEDKQHLEALILEKLSPLVEKAERVLNAGDSEKSAFFFDIFCKAKGDLGEASKILIPFVERLCSNMQVKIESLDAAKLPATCLSKTAAEIECLD
jgi:hypothetical protein